MVVQARAHATRQKFIDAAVDLFEERGYGSTGLNDIVDLAGMARTAFYYYYFPTKESVVPAIFEQADARCEAALTAARAATSPLEFLIRMTFVVAETTQYDKVVRVGNLLRQSLTQVSPAAQDTFDTRRRLALVDYVQKAIAQGELLGDVDPDAVGHTILVGLLGTRLLSDATGEDVFARLAQVWTVILRGSVAPRSALIFYELVNRLSQQAPRRCATAG
jgi:AcrR family transcriptional regulator